MNGMFPSEFNRKIKKLNPSLWVDLSKIAYPYSREYPTCGLYKDKKFLIGVPQKYVPEWTVSGVDFKKLTKSKKFEDIVDILDKGFIPEGSNIEERLLWRGYRSILAHLCRLGHIDRQKAQKLFHCEITPNRMEFPRNFVQLSI